MSVAGITETTQYLTFTLGDEIFAVSVDKVLEILDMAPITKVPRTPEFMRGVINVRGSVVPVVDMRLKLGMSRTEQTMNTGIVVMEVTVDEEKTVVGALVDAVQEVSELEADQIEPPPRIGTRWKTEFIKGIAKHSNEFIIILDIDRIFSTEEIALVQDSGI